MNKWTRRGLLTTGVIFGGGLVLGIAIRPGNRTPGLAPLVTDDGETLVHTWVKLDTDNRITVIVPHSEMGQGVGTALSQMLADELDADWNLVSFEEAPAIEEFANHSLGQGFLLPGVELPAMIAPSVEGVLIKTAQALDLQITGGSMSIRATGQYGMRVAGAAVRELLVESAAEAWNVPVSEVSASKSYLAHEASGRRAPYSEFASAAAEKTPSLAPRLKTPDQFTVMGTHVERHDIPAKVDGSALFAMDVQVPGMLYATVRRAPTFGGNLAKLDDKAARGVRGVKDVISLPADEIGGTMSSFAAPATVAVVADSYWSAKQGLDKLELEWSSPDDVKRSSDDMFAQFDRDISQAANRQADIRSGDVAGAISGAAAVVKADYQVPFLAHTCMEPQNATVSVTDSGCEVWVGCQNPLGFRSAIADALGMDSDAVVVNNHFMGGGFGRRAIADCAVQAALLSQKMRKPVQVVWSREEDVRQDYYRPAIQSRFSGALDENGNLLAWENTYVNKHEPAEAPLIPYSVDSLDIGHVESPTHVPFGAWRSVDHSQHGFFTESFIDEVAIAAGQDPYQYRMDRLKDKPRHRAVLKKAAEAADWGTPLGSGRGRGISLQESFGSLVAQVVEVSLVNGETQVDRVVAAIDAGVAVSPDGLTAQIESGIIYGLTAALYGEITIEDGAVAESNFHDYQALRMPKAPIIETHIINSDAPIGGAGEPGTPGIAPALANAVFDASGVRVRRLPMSRPEVKMQLEDWSASAA
ncbi:MAG: molybdopterin-dependent oxidoreductase [Pseudomonadaceae bacterium]|nr:molybdopterin-dependent oxidoreductase [Pseudomonadaceae bacterium]